MEAFFLLPGGKVVKEKRGFTYPGLQKLVWLTRGRALALRKI